MTKQKFLKLALYSLIIGLIILVINYFFYHFVTSEGISLEWHKEPGKPFVSNMIGQLAVLFLFMSAASLLIALVCYKEEK